MWFDFWLMSIGGDKEISLTNFQNSKWYKSMHKRPKHEYTQNLSHT